MSKSLSLTHLREISFFALSGGVGYVVDLCATAMFSLVLGPYAGRVPAFVLAATSTWLINRSVTFHNRKSGHRSLIKEYAHYLSVMIAGLSVNYAVYAISVTLMANGPYKLPLCVALGSIAGMFVNYITSRRYIYTRTKDGHVL